MATSGTKEDLLGVEGKGSAMTLEREGKAKS